MSFDLHYAKNWTNLIMVNCRGLEGMALSFLLDFNFLLLLVAENKECYCPKANDYDNVDSFNIENGGQQRAPTTPTTMQYHQGYRYIVK